MVRDIVNEADVVLEIIDARFPAQSRNLGLEQSVLTKGKKLLIVVNKSDLISLREAKRVKAAVGPGCVFVSAKAKTGIARLKGWIGQLSGDRETKIAVTGYPNTGKSSIINMLKGRKAARTSSIAGFTKGKQFVRISRKILLIDSPGVIPFEDKDETLMALLSVKNPHHLSDLEGTGIEVGEFLLKSRKEEIEGYYGVSAVSGEELLEKIAFKRNKLLKGARPDTNAAARIIISDFQEGRTGKRQS